MTTRSTRSLGQTYKHNVVSIKIIGANNSSRHKPEPLRCSVEPPLSTLVDDEEEEEAALATTIFEPLCRRRPSVPPPPPEL